MTDLGRFADSHGVLDARRAYRAARTLDRLFINCARIQVHADDHVGRVSDSFEILDLLDGLVDRDLTPRLIYRTLLSPTQAAAIFGTAFADAPTSARAHLEKRTAEVLAKLKEETLAHVLEPRRQGDVVLVGSTDPQPMAYDEYIGRLYQAMRDTHHGYHLNALWKRNVLDTNTGHISVAFPELIVLLLLAFMANPERAISGAWFDDARAADEDA